VSVGGAIVLVVEVTESDVARIPRGNVRVPRAEFVAVWREAARRAERQDLSGRRDEEIDWYDAAVASTCRWLAGAPQRSERGNAPPRSPATDILGLVFEERIEAEYLAAQDLERRRPSLARRSGWCPAVRATLRWAWRHEGPPPVELPTAQT
jgi:hypothetical protein